MEEGEGEGGGARLHLEKPLLLGDARRSYAMLGDATRGMVA